MHIMLAVDDSQYAKAILTWMRRFPHPSGTRITLLHVLELLDVPEEFSAKPGLRQKQRVQAESLLAGAAQELQKAYADVKVSIVEGFPIYEILRPSGSNNRIWSSAARGASGPPWGWPWAVCLSGC